VTFLLDTNKSGKPRHHVVFLYLSLPLSFLKYFTVMKIKAKVVVDSKKNGVQPTLMATYFKAKSDGRIVKTEEVTENAKNTLYRPQEEDPAPKATEKVTVKVEEFRGCEGWLAVIATSYYE
jgi:hypothetical protein